MKDSFLNKRFKYTYFHATLYLIAINIIVYLIVELSGYQFLFFYNDVFYRGTLREVLSLIPPLVNQGYVWQFITHMFVHGNIYHLLFNMLCLYMLGTALERVLGSWEFLLFYFLCGILAGAFSYGFYVVTGNMIVALMGASGAIYALMFLFAVLFPGSRFMVFFVIPLKAPIAMLVFAAIEAILQITGADNGVAHLTHLAGIGLAWLYVMIRFGLNPIKVWKENL